MALKIPEWRGRPYRTTSKEDMEQYEKDFEKNQANGFLEACVFIFGILIFGIFIWLIQ